MKVFVSNNLSQLSQALWQELFTRLDSPLGNRWVIVPTEESKQGLYLKWLEQSPVVTGIKTITYRELMRRLFPEIPSKMELALRIEAVLEEARGLQLYLEGNSLKKIELSSQLSTLFLKYLSRPANELLEWLKVDGWQQEVWKEVFGPVLPTAAMRPLVGDFYFYNITAIAPHEWEALSLMETSWFVFSPSQMFLGDLISERSQEFVLRKASKKAQGQLLHYFEQDSPLLSNWIGHGQTAFQYLEEGDTIECFKKPQHSSALSTLQTEWLFLEKQTAPPDDSIQLHSAPNLVREVEVVWEIIQRLPYNPREVVVLAPDINLYAASIEWVFQQRKGPFHYSIDGIAARAHSPLLQGMQLLLSLPSHRFSREIFKKLLLSSPFLNRFDLTHQEGETLATWIEELHLRYDLSGHHVSWHGALRRAIEGLIKQGSFDFSDTPLLNRWIEITLLLEKELAPLTDGKERSGQEWAALIQRWMGSFFKSDEEADSLKSVLATLRKETVDGLFPYATIEHHLNTALTNPTGSVQQGGLESVRFTSLTPGCVPPAKAIICMGMHEGSFPRLDPPTSLAQLPIPNKISEDRYLFLEMIAHAEKKLILTYQRCHPDDGKEMLPSHMVQELIKDRGGLHVIHHPPSPLDPFYYMSETFRSYSTIHYRLLHNSAPAREVLPLPSSHKKTVDLRVLKKLARHPVQCFLEEGLGLRFPLVKEESEFLFSPLEMHLLRKKSLRCSTAELIDELDRAGKLPSGTFRKTAILSIEKEIEAYRKTLSTLQVDPAAVFSLEMTPHATSYTRIADDYHVAPPIKISLASGETAILQGIIEGVSPQGLLFHGSESIEDLLKVWPLHLATHAALGISTLIFTKKEVTADHPVADPNHALGKYVDYLHKGLQSPSPLLPAWGQRVLKGEELPAISDDDILLWASTRNLLPDTEKWSAEWKSYLQEAFRELI